MPWDKNYDKKNMSLRRAKGKDKNSRERLLCQRFVIGLNVTLVELDSASIYIQQLAKGRIKKQDKPQLLNLKEGGYVCGDKSRARNDVMRRQIRCMDDHDIVSSSQIKSDHNVGGKNTLPICWKCYDGTKLLQCLHLVDAAIVKKVVPSNDLKRR